jgi:hypothetical protein
MSTVYRARKHWVERREPTITEFMKASAVLHCSARPGRIQEMKLSAG